MTTIKDRLREYRNIANFGRGSAMTKAVHELCNEIESRAIRI